MKRRLINRHHIRCALYTRKSTEEGLDQAFNSLDAQHEACAAYVKSQEREGWRAVKTRYDDGGVSGGTMERPALARLIADIEADRIDTVVVYKIDRLTRSLPDFARMIEIFDRHEVSFVSVTQAFNTTSSMGRLTLNVLLSFAQFEREVTGERIRDKIAASKARGMWMGGMLPLGYDAPADACRALVVNAAEAETVRTIFRTYLALGSVHALARWLDENRIRSKRRRTRSDREIGAQPFSRGALFHLLRNRVYLGMIVHKGVAHPGLHPAIVDADLFEAVQARLDANARRRNVRKDQAETAPLAGKIFDADGQVMSPTFSYGKLGKLYRYYVSAPLQRGMGNAPADGCIKRLSARPFEAGLATVLRRLIPSAPDDPLSLIARVELHGSSAHCLLPIDHFATMRERLEEHEALEPDAADPRLARVRLPLIRRRGQTWVLEGSSPGNTPDRRLIAALRSAHAMLSIDSDRRPVLEAAPKTPHRRRLVRLAFLSPQIQRAILAGRQPKGLTLARLLNEPIPLDWSRQAVRFGFALHPGSGTRLGTNSG